MGRRAVVFVAVVTASCSFSSSSSTGDDEIADAGATDAPFDAMPLGAWGTPTPVIPAGGDDDPTLTGDLLELYFNRADDIYVITRASIDAAWSAPSKVAELSSPSIETTPEITSDGLTIFVASDRPGGAGGEDVWVATRTARSTAWGPLKVVSALDSPQTDAASAPLDDLRTIVLISTRNGADADIFLSTRSSPSAMWGTPAPIVEVNSSSDDYSPFLSADGLTLYFDSPRGGNEDLYVATRARVTDPFSTPVPISELATSANETDPWVSPDGRHIFFESDRSGASGLWEASR